MTCLMVCKFPWLIFTSSKSSSVSLWRMRDLEKLDFIERPMKLFPMEIRAATILDRGLIEYFPNYKSYLAYLATTEALMVMKIWISSKCWAVYLQIDGGELMVDERHHISKIIITHMLAPVMSQLKVFMKNTITTKHAYTAEDVPCFLSRYIKQHVIVI